MSARVAFIVSGTLRPLMKRTTISPYVPPVVDVREPDHIWMVPVEVILVPFEFEVLLMSYIQRLAAEEPAGSWLIAMTAGLERMLRSAGAMERMSLPMIKGLLAAAPKIRSAYV